MVGYGGAVSDVPAFKPDPRLRLHVAVADHIAARIGAGELTPDEKLPGVDGLASEYGVAVGTARSAIRELVERELVFIVPSKGTFIAAPPG
jgi:GntR family transcriptional regulator